MAELTRRAFITRTGTMVGAVSLAGLAGNGLVANALAADALSERRRGTYAGLVDAVAELHSDIDRDRVPKVTDAFAARYQGEDAFVRRQLDYTLDALDEGKPGSFASRTRAGRLRTIARHTGANGDELCPQIMDAVLIARQPFSPPGTLPDAGTTITLVQASYGAA
jgi:hypothetical protein